MIAKRVCRKEGIEAVFSVHVPILCPRFSWKFPIHAKCQKCRENICTKCGKVDLRPKRSQNNFGWACVGLDISIEIKIRELARGCRRCFYNEKLLASFGWKAAEPVNARESNIRKNLPRQIYQHIHRRKWNSSRLLRAFMCSGNQINARFGNIASE